MPSLKRYFVTGLLVLLPLGVTLWVMSLVVSFMNYGLLLLPLDVRSRFPFDLPGMGVALTLITVFAVGLLTANFIGRRLLLWWEALLRRIPIVNSVYSSVKQVSDTLFSPSGQAFRQAVLLQFPRPGAWTVGFVVGAPSALMADVVGAQAQTVYVPTAPNPTSGYIVMVSADELVEIDISVEDALKFVVSMGVANPQGRRPSTRSPVVEAR